MTLLIDDPLELFAQERAKHPGELEAAHRVMLDVQAQMQRLLFGAPRVRNVDIHIPPPRTRHHATMVITFKVEGHRWKKQELTFLIDGRQVDKAKLNGRFVPTRSLAKEAAVLIAAAVNQ